MNFETGELLLNGDEPIPVREPPCKDDDKFCVKVRPGHSDFDEVTGEIYQLWRLCNALDEHPDDRHYKRYRRILDSMKENIERHREESKLREMQEAIEQLKRRQ